MALTSVVVIINAGHLHTHAIIIAFRTTFFLMWKCLTEETSSRSYLFLERKSPLTAFFGSQAYLVFSIDAWKAQLPHPLTTGVVGACNCLQAPTGVLAIASTHRETLHINILFGGMQQRWQACKMPRIDDDDTNLTRWGEGMLGWCSPPCGNEMKRPYVTRLRHTCMQETCWHIRDGWIGVVFKPMNIWNVHTFFRLRQPGQGWSTCSVWVLHLRR